MRRYILLCLFLLTSCGIHKSAPTITQTDSVRVEYRERIVRDTVNYTLPVIIEKNVTEDTVSVIENDFFISRAEVHDGLLEHEFRTKPHEMLIPVEFPVHELKVTTNRAEIRTERIEVKVPRDLTFWEKFKIRAMGWLIGSAIILVGCFAAKVIRKRFPTL